MPTRIHARQQRLEDAAIERVAVAGKRDAAATGDQGPDRRQPAFIEQAAENLVVGAVENENSQHTDVLASSPPPRVHLARTAANRLTIGIIVGTFSRCNQPLKG